MLGIVAYLTYVERKVAGHIQSRPGPNRVGPLGLFQPFADILKLLLKEEFIPAGANKVLFHLAPILAVVPALTSFAVVPVGPNFVVTDVNVGLLVFLAMSSLGVYAMTLAGWSSNNKYALLGGLRSSAQMISYELALGLSTVGVILLAGSLSLVDIVHAQAGLYHARTAGAAALVRVHPAGGVRDLPGLRLRRDEPRALRPARGGVRAGGRLPHRVLQHEVGDVLPGRVHEHASPSPPSR